MHRALSARPRLDRHPLGTEALQRLIAHPLLQRRIDIVHDGLIQPIECRVRLRHRDPGLHSPEEVDPVGVAALHPARALGTRLHHVPHRQRDVDVRTRAQRGAFESPRRNTNDREGATIDDHRPADCGRIAAEPVRPERVAEDHDVVRAQHAIVGRREQSTERWLDPERGEVRPRDHQSASSGGLVIDRETRPEHPVGREPREHRRRALEVAEHRVAEHDLAAACLRAALHTGLGAGCAEVDQLLRFGDRERTEQDLVEEREDRRVGADAESQREDRDRGHEWRLQQHARRELQILHHSAGKRGPRVGRRGYQRFDTPRPRTVWLFPAYSPECGRVSAGSSLPGAAAIAPSGTTRRRTDPRSPRHWPRSPRTAGLGRRARDSRSPDA